ncbi:MAGa3780 family membrane protein [Mycoplasma procyoni]|uniref:MAGa3780 family membrane protein n=1 Tax=Mycoplasma procyoni TaxID=568784 RepID=UPI00197C83F5|nr:hypothetical protein [Mycoplasma procyoni]MBN3534401.1 hypothetical protein [Mycoplasma procyoni]
MTKNFGLHNLKLSKVKLLSFIFGLFVLTITTIFTFIDIFSFDRAGVKPLRMQVVFLNLSSLFYFTYQSNFLLGTALVCFGLYNNEWIKKALFGTVTLITITFIIYWTLIAFTSDWKNVYQSINSLITHAINPILGFIILILVRKQITINNKVLFYIGLYVFLYFVFMLVLYFSTYAYYKGTLNEGVVVYTFGNFLKPFFYKGGNIGVVVVLDILMFVLAFAIPLGLSLFWKAVLRIKYDKETCYIKDFKRWRKSQKSKRS